ncbi:MAG: NAD(P)-dependent oxidoreductase [Ruthenibacterium sp.]
MTAENSAPLPLRQNQTENFTLRSAVVTGPTGTVGMALLRALRAKDITVYAVLRPDSPRAVRMTEMARAYGVIPVPCALSELSLLPQHIPPSVDAFFHLAWENTFGAAARNELDSQLRNVRHTLDAVRAAKQLGCKVFIGAGSQAEYGRAEGALMPATPAFPENGYGMAKLCAGQMSRVEAQSLGLRHIWARVLSVYGPYDGAGTMVSSVLRTLLQGETPACTKGEQLWDFLYSADAAEALVAMAEKGRDGAVYPLGSGQAKPLRGYLEAMRDAVNPSLTLGLGAVPYGEKQVMHLQADLTALTRDTGFVPRNSFAQGIAKTITWMKEEQA